MLTSCKHEAPLAVKPLTGRYKGAHKASSEHAEHAEQMTMK